MCSGHRILSSDETLISTIYAALQQARLLNFVSRKSCEPHPSDCEEGSKAEDADRGEIIARRKFADQCKASHPGHDRRPHAAEHGDADIVAETEAGRARRRRKQFRHQRGQRPVI